MRIAITGSTGMIGTALTAWLSAAGHAIVRVVRDPDALGPAPAHRAALWDPKAGRIDATALEGLDAVIHLAGENLSAGRWTERRKALMRESRTRGTTFLCQSLAGLKRPPRTLLSASAIGFYGNRDPAEAVDEESKPGRGFLADTCVQWEQATEPARAAGVRVVRMRFGLVLSFRGGALARMLPFFRLGLGGRLGSGEQVMSWIALDEIPSAVAHVLGEEALAGPVNFVAPQPVSNAWFTQVLGKVLQRPALIPVPGLALRAMFGEMADALLLDGVRVLPRRLVETGYAFSHPDLERALARMLT